MVIVVNTEALCASFVPVFDDAFTKVSPTLGKTARFLIVRKFMHRHGKSLMHE
jgi:hypothetical protein